MKPVSSSNYGILKEQYGRVSSLKAALFALETLVVIISLWRINIKGWNYHLLLLFILVLLSNRFNEIAFDSLTRTAPVSLMHLLPLSAVFIMFGLPEALLLNYISSIINILIERNKRQSGARLKAGESGFVFLIAFALLMLPWKRPVEIGELYAIYAVFGLTASFYLQLAVESYFASVKKRGNPSFYFKQIAELGYPNHLFLLVAASFLILTGSSGVQAPWLPFFIYGSWLVGLGFVLSMRKHLLIQRDRYALIIENLASLPARTEKDETKRRLMIEYLKKISAEAKLSSVQYDQTVTAGLIHDVGKAGIDIYSVDAVIEDIRAYKGDPLHAERAAEIAGQIHELEPVAEILRYHHRYQDREIYRRLRRSLRYQASLLNVAESMAELLIKAEEPIYDERHAYKDLKKDSGWDFDPRALRDLRKALLREGHRRL